MHIRWKTFITQTFLWLMAEIVLSLMGLDALADYGEYRLSSTRVTPSHHVVSSVSVFDDRHSRPNI